jgi:hypothetical protein
MIDRQLWQEHPAQAEGTSPKGEQHVACQRETLAERQREGHDAKAARELLRQFEEVLAMHVADRDRLRRELRGTRATGLEPPSQLFFESHLLQ